MRTGPVRYTPAPGSLEVQRAPASTPPLLLLKHCRILRLVLCMAQRRARALSLTPQRPPESLFQSRPVAEQSSQGLLRKNIKIMYYSLSYRPGKKKLTWWSAYTKLSLPGTILLAVAVVVVRITHLSLRSASKLKTKKRIHVRP